MLLDKIRHSGALSSYTRACDNLTSECIVEVRGMEPVLGLGRNDVKHCPALVR